MGRLLAGYGSGAPRQLRRFIVGARGGGDSLPGPGGEAWRRDDGSVTGAVVTEVNPEAKTSGRFPFERAGEDASPVC